MFRFNHANKDIRYILIILLFLCSIIFVIIIKCNRRVYQAEEEIPDIYTYKQKNEMYISVELGRIDADHRISGGWNKEYLEYFDRKGYIYVLDNKREMIYVMFDIGKQSIDKDKVHNAYLSSINLIEENRIMRLDLQSVQKSEYIEKTKFVDSFRSVLDEKDIFILYDFRYSRFIWSLNWDIGRIYSWGPRSAAGARP